MPGTWQHNTQPNPGLVIIGRIDTGLDLIAAAGDSFQLTVKPVD